MNKKTGIIIGLILVIIVVVIIVVVVVKNNSSDDKYKLEGNKDVDVICNLTADKTEVHPGDIIEIKLTVDKLPDNGYGIGAMDLRFVYDNTKLTLEKTINAIGEEVYDITPGIVGENLGLVSGEDAAVYDIEGTNNTAVTIAMAKASVLANKVTGEVVTFRFRVNDDASGNAGMYVSTYSDGELQFSVSGVLKTIENKYTVNLDTKYTFNTNIEQIEIH